MRSGNPLSRSTTTSSRSPLPPGPASLLGTTGVTRRHASRPCSTVSVTGTSDVSVTNARTTEPSSRRRGDRPKASGGPAPTLVVSTPRGPLPKSTNSCWVPVVALKAVSSVMPIPVTRSSPAAVVTNDQRRVVRPPASGGVHVP